MNNRFGCALTVLSGLVSLTVHADEATVAVAANFSRPMGRLETAFESATPHEITVVTGSTGQLYAQILNGAPYDLFLAADRERPTRLAQNGWASPGTQFTYALGQLALWTREPSLMNDLSLDTLADGEFRRLVIANPLLAPYGLAARETLEAMGLWASLQARIVRGENVGQAFAMVESRNAELGLIARSSALAYSRPATSVPVPERYHEPIRQDAVLLTRGESNPAADAFVQFLKSAQASEIIREAGYALP